MTHIHTHTHTVFRVLEQSVCHVMVGCCAVPCPKNFSAQSDPVSFCASDNKRLVTHTHTHTHTQCRNSLTSYTPTHSRDPLEHTRAHTHTHTHAHSLTAEEQTSHLQSHLNPVCRLLL